MQRVVTADLVLDVQTASDLVLSSAAARSPELGFAETLVVALDGQPLAVDEIGAAHGTRLDAMVRGKPVPMEVIPLPFIGTRYRKS